MVHLLIVIYILQKEPSIFKENAGILGKGATLV